MKKIILFIAFLSVIPFYGQQHRVSSKVQQLVAHNAIFMHFAPLTATINPDATKTAKIVNNASFATLDAAVIKQLMDTRPQNIELSIPYNGNTITVLLYRADLFAKGFHVDTDKKRNIAYQEGLYYRGIVKDDVNSLVSFSFFNNEMNGIVSASNLNNLVVGRLRKEKNKTDYILYSDANLKIPYTFNCNTTDPKISDAVKKAADLTTMNIHEEKCVTLYFELDNELYLQNGASETLTANWLTSAFNNVQTLYDNDGITVSLQSFFIWTTQDPYTGPTSTDYLIQFAEAYSEEGFGANLGQLLGMDPGGLGGLAWLEGFCSAGNACYVDVDLAFEQVPVYSFDIIAMTHELGHLMGSEHTHACVWNGNNTQIDGCGTLAGIIEGSCDAGPLPQNGGTIMSYCHLLDVGTNLANGFGPQPSARIHNYINSTSCIGTECAGNCHNTISAFSINNIDSTSATVTWQDEDEGPWETSFREFNSGSDDWQLTSTHTLTIGELIPNTYYVLAVRPVCPEGVSLSKEIIFATTADWCQGQKFTDVGDNHWYINDTAISRTFTTSGPDQKIKVAFTSFNLEDGYDFLNVYDGPNNSAPQIGHLTGTDLPEDFISTATDGSLTFEFTSDEIITADGWDAWISCVAAPLTVNDNTLRNLSYFPNPTNGSINITAGEEISEIKIYDIRGQLLLNKKVNAVQTTIDMASFSAGVYFFRASNGIKESNFKVIVGK